MTEGADSKGGASAAKAGLLAIHYVVAEATTHKDVSRVTKVGEATTRKSLWKCCDLNLPR